MGSTNMGSQQTSIQYGSPVDSRTTANLLFGVIPLGIYSGGFVTVTSVNSISVSPLTCCIGDGNYQVRISTTVAVSLTGLAAVNPTYLVLRWVYSAVTDNYMDILAITSAPNANDLVIAKLTGIGSAIIVDYTLRSNPVAFQKDLLVEPLETPGMYVRIRAGKISNGAVTYDIVDQISSLFTAPVVNPRIDVLGLSSTGTVIVIRGTEAASPSVPNYSNVLPLAEITLQTSSSAIVTSMIKNIQHALKTGGGVPSGVVCEYAGGTIPAGYLLCDGSAVSRTTYSSLYAAIGVLHGVGDGSTTFNLPTCKGRVTVGYDSSQTEFNTIGKKDGEKTHQLTEDELARHVHTGSAAATPGSSGGNNYPKTDALASDRTLDGTGYAGGDVPHNNLQPYIVFNKIIKI